MSKNNTAKILRVIGIIEAVCGVVCCIFFLSKDDNFIWLAVTIFVASFINCMVFVGFSEIIDLLQKSINKQDLIFTYLKEQDKKQKTPKSLLEDIELNLPKM